MYKDIYVLIFCYYKTTKIIKTDNGPAYTSRVFQRFLKIWSIKHSTGIPYNPQGQAIVERANQSLKHMIQKQKKGEMPQDNKQY